MSETPIRVAYDTWPAIDQQLRELVAGLSDEQLLQRPSAERWPLWATIGHLACQRVFWLCDFGGAPGADTTPFTDAGHMCPGDDDLEHVLGAAELVAALEATSRIVEWCLDHWTVESLPDVIRHPEWGADWVRSRGGVIQRVFSHDIHHCGEVNETLTRTGLPLLDIWV